MKYPVILTLGTLAVCVYLLFLVSPRYELGELRAENRELRERIISLERSQGITEIQSIILIGGGICLGLCFMLCYLFHAEINLRKQERMASLRYSEFQAYKLLFQNQSGQEIPQLEWKESK